MANETTPYISRNPGDVITAEDWNDVQVKVKEDMKDRIQSAKEQIKETGVDRADNADKFENRTPKDWTDELDERYAPKVHDHEGPDVYRRYFKRLKTGQTVALKHGLGCFPVVDVYLLHPMPPEVSAEPVIFYLYYHHEERDRYKLFTEDRGMVRSPWGTPLKELLGEYQVEWERDDSLGDVVNDFLDAFFKPPVVDHMEHKTSEWIDEHREIIIDKLIERDEWPNIRWVTRPRKLIVGDLPPLLNPPEFHWWVSVGHLSYDALEVSVLPESSEAPDQPPIDLMILLRS